MASSSSVRSDNILPISFNTSPADLWPFTIPSAALLEYVKYQIIFSKLNCLNDSIVNFSDINMKYLLVGS